MLSGLVDSFWKGSRYELVEWVEVSCCRYLSSISDAFVTMLTATNTTFAPAFDAIAGLILTWLMFVKPDRMTAFKGTLGGGVGSTANSVGCIEMLIA